MDPVRCERLCDRRRRADLEWVFQRAEVAGGVKGRRDLVRFARSEYRHLRQLRVSAFVARGTIWRALKAGQESFGGGAL